MNLKKILDRRLFFADVLKNRKPEVTVKLQDHLLYKELRKKQKECDHDYEIVGSRNGKLVTKSQSKRLSRQEYYEIKKNIVRIKYKKCGLEESNSKINDSKKTNNKRA